jgi:hypothetical protein
VKKAKARENDTSSSDRKIEDPTTFNTRVRFIRKSTGEQQGVFHYDTATTYHSTNRLELL